jgi:putative transposase
LGGQRGRLISEPNRKKAIDLIAESVTSGARLFKACNEIGISKRTFKRWISSATPLEDQRPIVKRPTPKNKLSVDEKNEIIKIVNQYEYKSLPPSQIVPTLADQGIYLGSESTFYRVLNEENMNNHRGRSKSPVKRPISTHSATAPNRVWMWDITWLGGPAKGIYYYLYLILDLFSRKIVAWEIWPEESADHASTLIKRCTLSEQTHKSSTPLVLHSDNGSPMKGATMLQTLYTLGITPSRSRPRVSNDNPYAESIFRTCKYRPDYPMQGFIDINSARKWVLKFVHWYNFNHKHSGLNFITPHQRHTDQADTIFNQRDGVYKAARERHPERWSNSTRNWSLENEVWLNPEKITKSTETEDEKIS